MSSVCRKLGISRQNYYARRKQRRRQKVDEELVVALVVEERRVQPRLGTRKLHRILQERLTEVGVKVGRDRLFELLEERGLLVQAQSAEYPRTTNSYHCLPVFTNQIKDLQVAHCHQVWVVDLTYIRTEEGFLFLAMLTDKYSRKIIGDHCSDTLEAEGCVQALDMALAQLPAGVYPIHHSDRGTQYCCHEYVNRLVDQGLTVSMTETNHCAENALAERMNGILKSEYLLGRTFKTKTDARRAVAQSIQVYNTRRPHTSLDYDFPARVHSRFEFHKTLAT